MLFSLANCAVLKDFTGEHESGDTLARGHKHFARRDYEGALEAYQKVISMPAARSEKTEALFSMGLIYAHFGYSKKSYDKALRFFIRILNEYPESSWVEQARIWVGVLQEHGRLSKSIEKSRETIKGPEKVPQPTSKVETKAEEVGPSRDHLVRGQRLLAQGDYDGSLAESQKILAMPGHRSQEDEALFNLGLIYAHFGNPKRDPEKALDYFKRLIKDHPKSPWVEQARMWVEMLQENDALNRVIQKLKQVDIEVEEKKREKTK
jgi:tetratricopeptide (TPR) repeat protein